MLKYLDNFRWIWNILKHGSTDKIQHGVNIYELLYPQRKNAIFFCLHTSVYFQFIFEII